MIASWLRLFAFGIAAFGALVSTGARAGDKDAVAAAQGLWAYTLLQAGGSGTVMPLTGVILFKDGLFAQQSVYDGAPFEEQGAMAHAGPFGAGPRGVHMVGEQTISISPGKTPAMQFRADTQHDISVDRNGEEMTIVFASGTIQKFRRIGPAKGDIHKLENGVLALVDDHFVLVAGDANAAVTGFGTFRRDGSAYELQVTRWSEGTPASALNRKDVVVKATFDGKLLTLADGRTFRVAAAK
jgi:hypothetical protein